MIELAAGKTNIGQVGSGMSKQSEIQINPSLEFPYYLRLRKRCHSQVSEGMFGVPGPKMPYLFLMIHL